MVKSIIKKAKKDSITNKKEQKKELKVHKPALENKKVEHKAISNENEVQPIIKKNIKPITEIKSLKEMEEIILEKFEEPKLEKIELPEKVEKPAIDLIVERYNDEVPRPAKADAGEAIHDDKQNHDNEIKDYKERVEAILFAVGKYLDDEMISQLCDIDKRHTKKALEELKKEYDERNTALMVVQEGNNWKINVREKYLSLVRKIVADTELSKSVMETLAVIAWKTPVYQNEIVRIRGNKCYDHIEELVIAGFVTKDKKGRSYVLKTTEKFYNYFDIDHKNLHGIMSEAKMPTEQKTLDEVEKPEEKTYSRENLLHALETIETKSIVQTDEDKLAQKQFLEQIHSKIEESSKRTDEVISEIPKPMHQQENIEQQETIEIEETPAPLVGNAVVEKTEEDIVINTDEPDGTQHHFQKPEEQPQKPKQLTKKQLEKKFKDELQRVKEKSGPKK